MIESARRRRIGIPFHFTLKTLETFVATTAEERDNLEWCHRFAEGAAEGSPASGLLTGDMGNGKTHLACGIATAVAEQLGTLFCESTVQHLERVHYTTTADIVRDIKASWESHMMTEKTIRDKLIGYRLLIIDEVGAGTWTDFARDTLFGLLDARYGSVRPTLFVSNLGIEELTEYLTPRGIDRLREHGADIRVFSGESHRGKQG